MSEWLTTGEMIDRLKVGEIAELEEGKRIPKKYGPSYSHVIKASDGDIRWCKEDGTIPSSSPLEMYGHVLIWKWRILPNYVSFEEAMKALREGKTVSVHIDGKTFKISHYEAVAYRLSALEFEHYGLIPLMNDKWTIEE